MTLIGRVLLASLAPLTVVAAGCGLIGYGDSGDNPPTACFPSIAVGDDHTCVVNRSGHVYCWGADDHGQTSGSPGGGLRAAPVAVTLPGAVSASAVAAGPATSCALHGRLGLAHSCAALDINLGCSGYIYGLWTAALMAANCRWRW